MVKLEKLDKAIDALKALKRERAQYEKMRNKELTLTFENSTKRQRDKLRVDVSWLAMHIAKLTHHAHVAVVESGLANPFEDDYYGQVTYNPDGWHEMNFTRERPAA